MNEKIVVNSNQIITNFGEKMKNIDVQFNTKANENEVVKKGRNIHDNKNTDVPCIEIANTSSSSSVHLTNGEGFTAPYIVGIGKDGIGTGVMLPNKANGHMISGRQYGSVNEGNWLKLTQESTSPNASAIHLESNVADAARLIEIITTPLATDTQELINVGDAAGNAGAIMAKTGAINWKREIILDKRENNSKAGIKFIKGSITGKQDFMFTDYNKIQFFTWTGSPNLWYPFEISTGGNTVNFSCGNNTDTVGSATFNPLITLQNNKLGFYGVTPVAKQTNVAVTVEALHTALIKLGLIGG